LGVRVEEAKATVENPFGRLNGHIDNPFPCSLHRLCPYLASLPCGQTILCPYPYRSNRACHGHKDDLHIWAVRVSVCGREVTSLWGEEIVAERGGDLRVLVK
jgi:hypothetical protein